MQLRSVVQRLKHHQRSVFVEHMCTYIHIFMHMNRHDSIDILLLMSSRMCDYISLVDTHLYICIVYVYMCVDMCGSQAEIKERDRDDTHKAAYN